MKSSLNYFFDFQRLGYSVMHEVFGRPLALWAHLVTGRIRCTTTLRHLGAHVIIVGKIQAWGWSQSLSVRKVLELLSGGSTLRKPLCILNRDGKTSCCYTPRTSTREKASFCQHYFPRGGTCSGTLAVFVSACMCVDVFFHFPTHSRLPPSRLLLVW